MSQYSYTIEVKDWTKLTDQDAVDAKLSDAILNLGYVAKSKRLHVLSHLKNIGVIEEVKDEKYTKLKAGTVYQVLVPFCVYQLTKETPYRSHLVTFGLGHIISTKRFVS